MPDQFAKRIVESTIGAALLSVLEQLAISDEQPEPGLLNPVATSDPESVAKAVALVNGLSLGRLLELAVLGADSVGSFYEIERADPVFRFRGERAPIAEAIAGRSDGSRWFQTAAAEQWWWTDGTSWAGGSRPGAPSRIGADLHQEANWWATHPNWAVLTTSPLPDPGDWTTLEALVRGVWDLCFGPIRRWRVTVDRTARVYEVHSAEDWAGLVTRYPKVSNSCHRLEIEHDLVICGYDAANLGAWKRFLTPDWEAVAADWDGIHLSWAGYLTADGTLMVLGQGDVTMLRNWGSERTVWLSPVLLDAAPLPVPAELLDDPSQVTDRDWAADLEQWESIAR